MPNKAIQLLLVFSLFYYIGRSQEYNGREDDLPNSISDLINGSFGQYNGIDSVLSTLGKNVWASNLRDLLHIELPTYPSWQFESNTFYASGSSASAFGNGLFANINIKNQMELAGIPFQINAGLVMQNNRFDSRLSSLSLSFDQQALLEKFKREEFAQFTTQSIPKILGKQQPELERYLKTDLTRQVLYSDTYRDFKEHIRHSIDSLSQNVQEKADSLVLDSLKVTYNRFQKAEMYVDSVYNACLTDWNFIQSNLATWQDRVEKEQKQLEQAAKSGNFNHVVSKFHKSTGLPPILLNITKLNVGSYRIQGSSFDISSIPLHGANIEFRRAGYFASINYGKEGKQQGLFPGQGWKPRLLGERRTVFQTKTGIGMPDESHIHLSYCSIHMPGVQDSNTFSFPKRNVLVSLESRYLVSRNFFVTGDVSISNADFAGQANSSKLLTELFSKSPTVGSNTAGLLRFGWKGEKGLAEYSIGYQSVGVDYVSLGNLFLITGRNAFRFDVSQSLPKKKGQLKLSYVRGKSHQNAGATNLQQGQFSGDFSYRIGKRGSRVWATYSPTYFLQNNSSNVSNATHFNMIAVGSQWVPKAGKRGQFSSVLLLSNYSGVSNFGDTSLATGLFYGMLVQNFSMKKYQAGFTINVGLNADIPKSVQDLNLDFYHSFPVSKMRVSQGIQLVKRYHSTDHLVGLNCGIQYPIQKHLQFGFGGTWFLNLTNGNNHQYYVNSSASWQF